MEMTSATQAEALADYLPADIFTASLIELGAAVPENATTVTYDLRRTDGQALPRPPVLGLLTGNIKLGAEIKLRHFELWETFQFGGFADDHEDRNQIAVAALERGRRVLGENLSPQEIIVVGDTQFDIRCGQFIGAKALAVATGGAKLDELKKHKPDWAVEDLTHVSAREVCSSYHKNCILRLCPFS